MEMAKREMREAAQGRPNIREALRGYMEEHEMSIAAVARLIGVSRSTLSKWLNGREDKKIERRIWSLLTDGDIEIGRFVETGVVRTVWEIIEEVYELARVGQEEIAVIVAEAGWGKTRALLEYRQRNPHKVVYLRVSPTHTERSLVEEIADELGLGIRGATRTMVKRIVEALRVDKRVLVIDEAQALTVRRLEVLRTIHDEAKVGMVLAGVPELEILLRFGRGREHLPQLFTRVGYFFRIDADEATKIKTCEELLTGWGLKLEEKVKADVVRMGVSNGIRAMERMVRRAVKIADLNARPVDEQVVRAARQFLLLRG